MTSDTLDAIWLGIVEGLTEFLPVSSTAHLRITQLLLGHELQNEYWKMFVIVIQLGAILAVVVSFWTRLIQFVRDFRWSPVDGKVFWKQPIVLVAVSFLVTAAPCFLINEWIGDRLDSLVSIGLALLVGGIAMAWIDVALAKKSQTHSLESMTMKQAIAIGAFQILAAAFPGTSRSMATIAGGQFMGLDRSTALQFSFFLSIPVMFAASGFKLIQYLAMEKHEVDQHAWLILALGFSVSFLVAWIVIAWFLQWVRHHGFIPFAVYRILVGGALLGWILLGAGA